MSNKTLQKAYDELMLSPASESDADLTEYTRLWENYKRAGGSLTMLNDGIDSERWKKIRDTRRCASTPIS